jgi:drug/metabolite transporter (DMT)-like permease
MLKNLTILIVLVGCIISAIIEIPKRSWKHKHQYMAFPTWIPMTLGGTLSIAFAVLVYFLLRSYPSLSELVLEGTTAIVILPYAIVFFLAQYFTSMEIVKRIVNGFLKLAGINIEE